MVERNSPPVFNGRLDYITEWRGICDTLSASQIPLLQGYEASRQKAAAYTYMPYPFVLGDEIPDDVTMMILGKERWGVAHRDGKGGFYLEVSPEQLFLDELTFNKLGLTGEERRAVWDGLCGMACMDWLSGDLAARNAA